MKIINTTKTKAFVSGDNCIIRELLSSKNVKGTKYSIAHAIVKPKNTTKKHKLKSSEVYYILDGNGIVYISNESKKVKKDDLIYIPPNSIQCIKNTGKKDLLFLCIVSPAWKKEDEIVLES